MANGLERALMSIHKLLAITAVILRFMHATRSRFLSRDAENCMDVHCLKPTNCSMSFVYDRQSICVVKVYGSPFHSFDLSITFDEIHRFVYKWSKQKL